MNLIWVVAILRNWYTSSSTSQTNVDNVNVSYVNKTSNHFLLIIGRPTIYTHTKNFMHLDATAFTSFFLCEPLTVC